MIDLQTELLFHVRCVRLGQNALLGLTPHNNALLVIILVGVKAIASSAKKGSTALIQQSKMSAPPVKCLALHLLRAYRALQVLLVPLKN